MRTIHKYEIPMTDLFTLRLPKGAIIRSFNMQREGAFIWCEVDTDAPLVPRNFRMFGTGHPIFQDNLEFVGTVFPMQAQLVFHLYEVVD